MDLPLFWDPELLERDIHKVVFYPELQSRFGIIKRYGTGDSIRWFNADPAYIYHICSAREDGNKIILDGCRMESPAPPPEVLDSELPVGIGRAKGRDKRIEWFLANTYCSCSIAGDGCTGMFYTLAS